MTMEAVLRMSCYPQLSPSAHENVMKLFLSEYPNKEIHKRCWMGTTRVKDLKNQNEKKKGLIIESDDSDDDVDDNKNSCLTFPRDELGSSAEEESESDSKD